MITIVTERVVPLHQVIGDMTEEAIIWGLNSLAVSAESICWKWHWLTWFKDYSQDN